MNQTRRLLWTMPLAVSLAGCMATAPLSAPSTKGIAEGAATKSDGKLNPAGTNGNGEANPNDNGHGNNGKGDTSTTPGGATTTDPQPAATSGPSSDIGLGTFFDTYNFDFPVPTGQALGAVARPSQRSLPVTGGKVYLQIGLQTVAQALATRRQPLNLSFVFDRSGSMYGEKIDYTRLAAKRMIDQLGDQDRFSLVTFDTNVKTLIMPTLSVDREGMKARVDGILPGSATNIDGGLAEGYSLVASSSDSNRINRVVLMSDGEANVGITDLDTLATRAADEARTGTSLSTIGVGQEFNESFMTKLAEHGQGSFYYVNSEEDALASFVGEVKSLQKIVAKGVKLNITLGAGVTLTHVYGHTADTADQSLNFTSNDLMADQSKVVLLELDVPAGAAGTDHDLAELTVDYEDVPFGGFKQVLAAAQVAYSADAAVVAASRDNRIASSVIILETAAKLLAAAQALDSGDVAGAKALLQAQFDSVTAKAAELNDADLRNEAANLKQYLGRVGAEDASALAKELQYDAFQKQQGKKKIVK